MAEDRDALEASTELRDELIVEGRDELGLTQMELARLAGLSQSRIVEILARH